MTEIFKFTSLARKLAPFSEEGDETEITREAKDEEGEVTDTVTIKRKKPEILSIYWNSELIIISTNHQVEYFKGTHLDIATQLLEDN